MTALYLPARPDWPHRQRIAIEQMRDKASQPVSQVLRYIAETVAIAASTAAITLSLLLIFGS
ncbi:hypothetical protein SAMN04515647_4425 [Cohaesibacter sp. ES.047]|uniref:hypothetical protein n=1 Tax=Cohaesibacter sp. ES.047 TaxID=1798205 RepID=UPI000BB8CA3F|nr:hypothetical protein [Cohaesibacter sp. ES.047]SNY94102.1 hypothetical protein SAMN04515647_4425 [Cohaesibacter sp. ES.047]